MIALVFNFQMAPYYFKQEQNVEINKKDIRRVIQQNNRRSLCVDVSAN